MKITPLTFFNVLVGVTTMTIGIALVMGIQLFLSLISGQTAAAQTGEPYEVLIARPGENSDRPVEPKLELSCYDLDILPVWHELKKDQQFMMLLRSSTGLLNCSEIISVRRVDLNGDHDPEIFVRGKSSALCTPAGNCGFWVFAHDGDGVKKLLAASDYLQVAGLEEPVQKLTTGGYSDLLLKHKRSSVEIAYLRYAFDGRRYNESGCMYEVPRYTREREGGWQFVSCQEFEGRGGN